jgi:hypothetical protein
MAKFFSEKKAQDFPLLKVVNPIEPLFQEKPLWQFISPDIIISEDYQQSSLITKHPADSRETLVESTILEPTQIMLAFVVSDQPFQTTIDYIGAERLPEEEVLTWEEATPLFNFGGAERIVGPLNSFNTTKRVPRSLITRQTQPKNRVRETIDKITFWREQKLIISVQGFIGVEYEFCRIANFSYRHDKQQGNSCEFYMTLESTPVLPNTILDIRVRRDLVEVKKARGTNKPPKTEPTPEQLSKAEREKLRQDGAEGRGPDGV